MTNLLRDVTVWINDAIIIEGRGGQTRPVFNESSLSWNLSPLTHQLHVLLLIVKKNWDSPYTSLNCHYEAWNYKKKKHKKVKGYRKSV